MPTPTTIEKKRALAIEKAREYGINAARQLVHSRSRITTDRPDSPLNYMLPAMYVAPHMRQENRWRLEQLESTNLDQLSAEEVMEILIDMSPEMSRALWDLTRMFLAGFEVNAFKAGSEDVPDPVGQAAVDAFMADVAYLYGSFEVPLTRIVIGGIMRGAFFAEIVLDREGRMPVDLATPDPWLVRFREKNDPVRGTIWEPGQMVEGEFVSIDVPTVRYVPIDQLPGRPEGRSPLIPALGPSLFLLSLMIDMKRVIQQQGYPRIDIEVDVEAMNEVLEAGEFDTDEEMASALFAAVDEALHNVAAQYENVPPDAAYIHSSLIRINGVVGAVDASSMGAVGEMIQALERQASRGSKMMPLLMGLVDTADESDANRQWEIMSEGVSSMQHKCEAMLEHLMEQGMQAQGIATTIKVRFAELRVAELMRDSQVDALRLQTAIGRERVGYSTPDEAALYATGHRIPDELKDERMDLLNTGDTGVADAENATYPQNPNEVVADPGADRSVKALIGDMQRLNRSLVARRNKLNASGSEFGNEFGNEFQSEIQIKSNGHGKNVFLRPVVPKTEDLFRIVNDDGDFEPSDTNAGTVTMDESDPTSTTLSRAIDEWNATMPGYRDLLDAEPVNGE